MIMTASEWCSFGNKEFDARIFDLIIFNIFKAIKNIQPINRLV